MYIPTRESLDLVLTYLRRNSDGKLFHELAAKLESLITPSEVALALGSLVNSGRVRYGYNPQSAEERRASLGQDGRLRYYAASDYGLSPVSRDQSDTVLEYLVSSCHKEAVERNFPLDLTRVGVAELYEHFEGKMPRDGVGFAVDQLRQDKLVTFHIYGHNGRAQLSVADAVKYTVMAHDLRTEQPRWYHVYAGSEAAALEKLYQSQVSGALSFQGVAPGWVTFSSVSGSEGVVIERM